MEIVIIILAIFGAAPTIIIITKWAIRHLLGKISWSDVYKEIDLFVQTFKKDYQKDPTTIITLGYGGTIIGAYLAQFFPQSQFIHIPVVRDSNTGIRELNRQNLYNSHLGMVLIVSGIYETGLSLSAIIENLHGIGVFDEIIKSYTFLRIPHSEILENHDRPSIIPDYYSLMRKKAELPWYTARSPSTVTVTRAEKGFPLIPPRDLIDIKNLSLDFHQSKERIDLRSSQITELLKEYIVASSLNKRNYNVVIGGPGAIGKSELAMSLYSKIQDSTYLPLDSSIIETVERDKLKLDGYQFEAYNIKLVEDWLKMLNKEITFEVSPYDHSIRKCKGILQVNGNSKIRFIEWVFSLDSRIKLKKDLIIVIDAPDKARYGYLLHRVTDIRKEEISDSTLEAIRRRFNSINEQINPTLVSFDIRFILDGDRKIMRIDSNVPELNRLLQERF